MTQRQAEEHALEHLAINVEDAMYGGIGSEIPFLVLPTSSIWKAGWVLSWVI